MSPKKDVYAFFNQLKKTQESDSKLAPYLFYDNDADGLCSAALMLAYLKEEVGIYNIKLHILKKDEIQNLVIFSPTIFVDLPILPRSIENAQGQPILIIDHHVIPENVEKKENILYINPRQDDPTVYKPASFVIYDLLKDSEAIKKRAFIAAAGVIGDKGDENNEECKKLVEGFNYASVSKVSNIIEACFAINKTNPNFGSIMFDLINSLLECKSAEDFLSKPSKFIEQANEFQKDLEKTLNQAHVEKLNDTMLLIQINSKLISQGMASTILSDKYKNKTIFVVNKKYFKNSNISISCRSKIINCNILMREIASQIPNSSGGGHERAAAIQFPTKYFKEFINLASDKTKLKK